VKVVTFWCEWDIGLEGEVFSDHDAAVRHVTQALKNSGIEEPVDELEDQGLVGFEEKEVRT
jgi:hypothetical protein